MAELIEKYGLKWSADEHPLKIEMACLRLGIGVSKSFHFEQMRRIIWPELDGDHNGQRWHTLCRNEICSSKVTTLMGSGGSGKTHEAAWLFLCFYWVHPNDTVVLVSSIDLRGLDLRVWGEIKKLFALGQERFPWLPGHMLDSKRAISTEDLDEDKVRDLRKGIIGIPCIQNGRFVGLGKYVGIHQKHVLLIADEAQFMNGSFLSAFANLNQNEFFWAVVLGNPNDPYDSLGKAAEPKDGWGSHMQPDKTSTWDTQFMSGRCVNLIGTDSPNYDFPPYEPIHFKYLPNRKTTAETLASWGADSLEYHNQCVGSMRTGQLNKRVLTHDICRQFNAQAKVTWSGKGTTKIYGVDAAYGGDRCVGGWIEFGEDSTGKTVLCVHPPMILPIRIASKIIPEDQIADRVKNDCELLGIPAANMFHDSTGRGSLGTALARAWSADTNPIEFGGRPSDRPTSLDHFIRDPVTNQRRLKLCNEHYVNFVTELWYSIRYTVEAGQLRNLPDDVMEELCMRQWEDTKNNKRQVEPKTGTSGKPGMKERTGRSPDLADWLAICLEGARRRGFQIAKLGNEENSGPDLQWLEDLARKSRTLRDRHTLTYT